MRWAGGPIARSSPGEDRPLEDAVKPDKRTSEPADDTLAISLRVRLSVMGRERANGYED
jgi:hypothetical protein